VTPLVIERRRGRSLRSRIVTAAVNRLSAPYLRKLVDAELTPELRSSLARFDELSVRVPPLRGTTVSPLRVAGMDAEWVRGPRVAAAGRGAILYLHGGGWLFGGLNSHRRMTSRISAASGLPALALDYRMVPDVTFEDEIHDCVAGYRWLLDQDIAPDRIVIMGDSAGGYLVLAAALRARDAGLPMPAALVGISGVYDMSSSGKAAHANAARDRTGSLAALEWMQQTVLGGLDARDGSVSPVRASLAGLPPTLLTVSSSEVIFCDSEEMARGLAAAGVPCTLQIWERQLHVFQAFGGLVLPEARRSINEIGSFVNMRLRRS
jgi:epsilon-lactone hydrolase